MINSIDITVHGRPRPQGSKAAFVNKYTGKAQTKEQGGQPLADWRQDVKAAALNARANDPEWRTADGPVAVLVAFLYDRPKNHYRTGRNAHLLRDDAPAYVTAKNQGDIDKVLRSTFDALTAAGIWADDSLAVDVNATQLYSNTPGNAGARIRLALLGNQTTPVTPQVDTVVEQNELFAL